MLIFMSWRWRLKIILECSVKTLFQMTAAHT